MKSRYIFFALFLTGCVFLATFHVQAQISITKADIENALAIGTTSTGYTTASGGHPIVHIGPASGSAQIWDFRNYTYQQSVAVEFIDPAVAPQITTFPQANVVRKQWDDATQITVYQYNQITDAEYLIHGLANDNDTTLIVYNPPVPQMKFPMTLGTSWTYTGLPTTPYPGITLQTSYDWTVDAFGTVKLPEGDFQALRLKVITYSIMKSAGISYVHRSANYNFVSKTLNWAHVSIDTNDIGKEDVTTSGIGYEIASNTTGIEHPRAPRQSDVWMENYPNPFPQQTTIHFQLPSSGHVALKVFDALGRLVQVPVEGREPSGTHSVVFDATQLSPGLYFCRLTAGDRTITTTAIVQR